MKKQFLYIFLAVFSIGIPAQAITNQDVEEAATLAEKYQQHKKAKVYEFSVKAGFNIGGTSPMGLPAEIRQINSFSPTLSLSIGGDVIRWFSPKWGVNLGLRFETKGMETDASVKNYVIKLLNDGSYIEGIYTGDVVTKVNNQYLTLPIQAAYKAGSRWNLKAGVYVSFLLRGNFDGEAKTDICAHTRPSRNSKQMHPMIFRPIRNNSTGDSTWVQNSSPTNISPFMPI